LEEDTFATGSIDKTACVWSFSDHLEA